ncbi:MAG: hypothetical protein ABH834_06525 [Candidatus Altiarchaeota archaeon]
MSDKWIAFNVIGDSLEKTKSLLFSSFKASFWLKLALVVFLVNGGINAGSNSKLYEFDSPVELMANLPLLIVLAALFLTIILFFAYLGNIAVFVFLESVLQKKVEVFDWFQDNMKRGLKLFLFNIFLGAVTVLATIIVILPGIGIYQGISGGAKLIGLVAYGIVAATAYLALLIALTIVGSFTKDFVVPLMVAGEKGLRDSWHELAQVIKANKGQFIMYVAARLVLGILTGIVFLVITVIMIIILSISFFVIDLSAGTVGSLIFSPSAAGAAIDSPPIMIALKLAILALMVVFAYITTIMTLPIHVFHRYYSLLFIERIIPELGLLEGAGRKDEEDSGKQDDESAGKIFVEVDK